MATVPGIPQNEQPWYRNLVTRLRHQRKDRSDKPKQHKRARLAPPRPSTPPPTVIGFASSREIGEPYNRLRVQTTFKHEDTKYFFGRALSRVPPSESAGAAVISYDSDGQEEEWRTTRWVEKSGKCKPGMSVIDQLSWGQVNLVVATMHQRHRTYGQPLIRNTRHSHFMKIQD